MNRILRNKKAMSGLILWPAATILIFLILTAIYIPASVFIGKDKLLFGKEEVSTEILSKRTLVETERLMVFLNGDVEFEGAPTGVPEKGTRTSSEVPPDTESGGKKIKIRELIVGEPEENKEKFERFLELSENYVDKNFAVGRNEEYSDLWFRIYHKDELISTYPDKNPETNWRDSLDYDDFQFYRGQCTKFVPCCNPDTEILVYVLIKPNKKIALCAKYG